MSQIYSDLNRGFVFQNFTFYPKGGTHSGYRGKVPHIYLLWIIVDDDLLRQDENETGIDLLGDIEVHIETEIKIEDIEFTEEYNFIYINV